MTKHIFLPFVFCLLQLTGFSQSFKYPPATKSDQKDIYFGTTVNDPYRWLEDDNSKETANWVNLENAVTYDYLEKISFRDSVKARIRQLNMYPKYRATFRTGGVYFYFRNQGLENQWSIYYQKKENHVGQLFLDPNMVDSTGKTAVENMVGSPNSKYVAFTISRAGSDWKQIRIKEIKTTKTLVDSLDWVKFSNISWLGEGFFYSRYDKPVAGTELTEANKFHKVYYHQLGTPQSLDKIVYEDKENPFKVFSAKVTDDEKFLLINSSTGSTNSVSIRSIEAAESATRFLIKESGFNYDVIENLGDSILVFTNDGAPKGRLVLIDSKNSDKTKWRTIIPEQVDAMQSVTIAKNKLIVKYLHDAANTLKVYDFNGLEENVIKLKYVATINEVNGSKNDTIVFFSVTSFLQPTSIYKYITTTKKAYVTYEPKINFNKDDYESKQVWYNSKDGTKIPMFIVCKKGLVLDGSNPTLLFGYGGFNISKTPEFKEERLLFLEKGGVFAMPCLRGGGEFGEKWHEAGTKLKKQNVFDDFIAAAEYLIKEKYTSASKLAIGGRSNGGLLVGACMTQRPELFKVALPAVGVMDMLRYQNFTIGWSWKKDYGSSDNEKEFEALYKYSPLHNLKSGVEYPATFITTADHDDRVVPAHSFKFAATLQEKQSGNNPVLIRIDVDAGHGGSKSVSKVVEEQTDVFSFMMYNLGMTW